MVSFSLKDLQWSHIAHGFLKGSVLSVLTISKSHHRKLLSKSRRSWTLKIVLNKLQDKNDSLIYLSVCLSIYIHIYLYTYYIYIYIYIYPHQTVIFALISHFTQNDWLKQNYISEKRLYIIWINIFRNTKM